MIPGWINFNLLSVDVRAMVRRSCSSSVWVWVWVWVLVLLLVVVVVVVVIALVSVLIVLKTCAAKHCPQAYVLLRLDAKYGNLG